MMDKQDVRIMFLLLFSIFMAQLFTCLSVRADEAEPGDGITIIDGAIECLCEIDHDGYRRCAQY